MKYSPNILPDSNREQKMGCSSSKQHPENDTNNYNTRPVSLDKQDSSNDDLKDDQQKRDNPKPSKRLRGNKLTTAITGAGFAIR